MKSIRHSTDPAATLLLSACNPTPPDIRADADAAIRKSVADQGKNLDTWNSNLPAK